MHGCAHGTNRRQHLGDGYDDFHVVDGEVADLAVNGTLKPVLIHLADEVDHVALLEAQFTVVLRHKVIERSRCGLLPAVGNCGIETH